MGSIRAPMSQSVRLASSLLRLHSVYARCVSSTSRSKGESKQKRPTHSTATGGENNEAALPWQVSLSFVYFLHKGQPARWTTSILVIS
ncbi:hypothetical protein IWX48DRAFT_458243 [Phyllosticta citricarpa]